MINLFISSAFAQEAAAAAPQSAFASMMPFLLIFLVFYFLMIRPQKKKMQQEETMLKALGKGDEIYTKSGMIGVIAGMTDKVITLEVGEGTKLKILRSQIGGLAKTIFAKEVKKK